MTTKSMTVRRSTVLKIKIMMAILMLPLAIAAILTAQYYGPAAGLVVGFLWCVVVAAARPSDEAHNTS